MWVRRTAPSSPIFRWGAHDNQPAYGRAHPLLFYPMMAYERMVNLSSAFSGIRVNVLLSVRKGA